MIKTLLSKYTISNCKDDSTKTGTFISIWLSFTNEKIHSMAYQGCREEVSMGLCGLVGRSILLLAFIIAGASWKQKAHWLLFAWIIALCFLQCTLYYQHLGWAPPTRLLFCPTYKLGKPLTQRNWMTKVTQLISARPQIWSEAQLDSKHIIEVGRYYNWSFLIHYNHFESL